MPANRPSPRSDAVVALLAINAADACLALHNACIKWLAADYPIGQIVFLRNLFALLPIAAVIVLGGGGWRLERRHWPLYLLRAAAILGASASFFLALRFLGLAEATAIGFAAPFIIAGLSVPLLGERVGWRRWAIIGFGFLAVLIILQPGTAAFQPAALLALAAGFCYALSMVLSRRLSRSDSDGAVMLLPTVIVLAASLASAPFGWQMPSPLDWGLFAAIGLLAGLAFAGITLAYRRAEASLVAPFDYAALLWSVLLGWLVWQELPGGPVILGSLLLVAAGVALIAREARASTRGERP